jgi:beta-mannosidase
MPARVNSIAGHTRQRLTAGWEICSTSPDSLTGPKELSQAALQWLPAHAPSTVAACLRAAGSWSLDSPAQRFDAHDWWYRVRFTAPAPVPGEVLVLGFDGLATVAQVWLNGEPLLASDNMFLAHECRIDAARAGANELLIRFRALDRLLEAKRPRPKWRAPMVENQQLRWFRTTLLGRTPGWSPPAAAVGPWREVWLERRTTLELADLELRTGLLGAQGWIEVSATLTPLGNHNLANIALVVTRGSERRHSIALHRTPDTNTYSGRLEIPDVALWWPHTHGEPALYETRLAVALEGSAGEVEVSLGRTGFRTLTLDTRGGDFALHVNDVPVFCRGACWTPPDPVALDTSSGEAAQALAATIEQVRAAGLNMLRVGGTMVYESDAFLDLCDANGILLWQDFMFANMSYPEDDAAFNTSITAEARQQLSRLAGRPCLTVLCGNSEGEQQAAMWGAPRESWSPALFHETLARLARESRPDVPYWPSSAHGGAFPHESTVGTTSYYGVGAYLRPLEDARRSEVRFASECLAFANIPEERTVAKMPGGPAIRCHHPAWKARTPRDLGAGWDFDDVRDHYLTRLFGVNPLELRYADHDRYLALSRVVSGEVMASTLAEWRRKRSSCRGALIWFWRDLWPGAGWGVVDSQGIPKAAWHYLRRACQPVAVSISDEGNNGLGIHVTNESGTPLTTHLRVKLYRGGEINVGSGGCDLTLSPRETLEIPATTLFEGFLDLSYAYRFGPPPHDLVVASLSSPEGQELATGFHVIGGLNAAREIDVGLTATATARSDGAFDLKVSTRRFAQSVWIEIDGFEASDAYFHLAPGSDRTLLLRRAPREAQKPLRGRVHALNAHTPAKIELRA